MAVHWGSELLFATALLRCRFSAKGGIHLGAVSIRQIRGGAGRDGPHRRLELLSHPCPTTVTGTSAPSTTGATIPPTPTSRPSDPTG